MTDVLGRGTLLAVLHACSPVRLDAIAEGSGIDRSSVERALDELDAWLDADDIGLRVHRRPDGVALVTHEALAPLIRAITDRRPPRTLAPTTKLLLFALMRRRRPMTKAQLAELREKGRGGGPVDIDSALQTLRREGLIARAGWADPPGRAALYAATAKAHARFPDLDKEVRGILRRPTLPEEPAGAQTHNDRTTGGN